jgi:hypothetical protein
MRYVLDLKGSGAAAGHVMDAFLAGSGWTCVLRYRLFSRVPLGGVAGTRR